MDHAVNLLGNSLTMVIALVFLGSSITHLRTPSVGAASIQAVLELNPLASRILNKAAGLAEFGLGIGLFVSLLTRGIQVQKALLASSFILLGGYVMYLALALVGEPGAPCGCGSDSEQVTSWTVIRAGVLSVLAGIAAVTADMGRQETLFSVLAVTPLASAIAVVVWRLPSAMVVPSNTSARP